MRRWTSFTLIAAALGLGCSSKSDGDGGNPGESSCSPEASGGVAFSAPSGTFQGEVVVELRAGRDAEIRYTTNRTQPSIRSELYAGPLRFTSTTELRAQAFIGGVAQGVPTTAVYIARSVEQTHDLPLIVLDAYGHGPLDRVDRSFVDAAFLAWSGSSNALSAKPTVASRAGFHVRGQSSSMFEKTPYRVELRDAAAADRDCPLVGMPAEADWALVGPFPDKALIRNAFVYGLGRDMGLAAPRVELVELYVNVNNRPLAASDYLGVYTLVETIKNQRNRLNLKQLERTDTTLPAIAGGYIFKFDWRAAEAPILMCPGSGAACWSDLEVVDPDPLMPEQSAYLAQHLKAFSDALRGPNAADPSAGYPAYIDVRSFVDHVIVNEITRNMDAYVRSQYFYKDRDTKIFAGPLWDFDLTMNVGGSFDNTSIQGWQHQAGATRRTSDWFQLLIAEPGFRAELVRRYQELRRGLLSESRIDARIRALTSGLSAAAGRNFERWDILTDARVGPFTTPTAPTWEGQVEVLREWLLSRMQWLDTQWR